MMSVPLPLEPIFEGLQAQYMDCLQVNLAIMADLFHGAGTHLRLGCTASFTPTWQESLPTIDPGLEGRLAEASEVLGLQVDGFALVEPSLQFDHEVVFVVDDAYDLSWTPYYRRERTEHSYLLWRHDDRTWVVDGYHVDTPYGIARPAVMPLAAAWPTGRHSTGVFAATVRPSTPKPIALITEPVMPGRVTEYLNAYTGFANRRSALHRLTRETWLLARSRHLHAAYLATSDSARRAQRFSTLARDVYVAMRCVDRGRVEPTAWRHLLYEALCTEPLWTTLQGDGSDG